MKPSQAETDEPRQSTPTKGKRQHGNSGWYYLTRHQSVTKMVDALLDLPPRREFNQTELAEIAGVSRNSVGNHIDRLVELKIIERVSSTSPTRYRLNSESEVTELLIKLDGELNQIIERRQD